MVASNARQSIITRQTRVLVFNREHSQVLLEHSQQRNRPSLIGYGSSIRNYKKADSQLPA